MEMTTENRLDLLEWYDGVGFLPLDISERPSVAEFRQACEKENNALYRSIVHRRIDMIQRNVFYSGQLRCLDVGIGGGLFVREMNRLTNIETCGLDMDYNALRWLKSNEYESVQETYDILTFWDAFDMISEPSRYMKEYKPRYVTMSIPIYYSKEHIMSSPYFKSGKRFWFFSKSGLIDWMDDLDFSMISCSNEEDIKFGKNNYQTFMFVANTTHRGIYG